MQVQFGLGWLAVFASAFFFYMVTVTIRWAQSSVVIHPAFFAFGRFTLGFIIVALSMILQKRSFRADRYGYIAGRALGNTLAVYCFYQAVDVTTVANANILNMTYPIFVAMIAWFFMPEQRDGVASEWIGAFLIFSVNMVLSVRKARQQNI
jgi:drug/metabolite transporter (DMT)-like permease